MLLIYCFGIWNVILTIICYLIFRKKRTLFDDRFATTLTMCITMMSTMVIGTHLTIILSLELSLIFVLNFVIAVLIGVLFGSLFKFHSVLTGFYNGIIGSAMGVMIGAVLKDPGVCSIPIGSAQLLLLNMYQLCGFITLLNTIVIGLILYTLRV